MVPVFQAAAQSVVDREVKDILRQVNKDLRSISDFQVWLAQFFDGHKDVIVKRMTPVMKSLIEQAHNSASDEIGVDPDLEKLDEFTADFIDTYAVRHIGSSNGQIQDIIEKNPDDIAGALETRFDEWQERRAGKIANREVVQLGNAAVVSTFLAFGVTTWRWQTVGDDCPACTSLNGKIVGQSGSFFDAGETVKGPGEDPIKLRTKIAHPPIHQGCDCVIVAE